MREITTFCLNNWMIVVLVFLLVFAFPFMLSRILPNSPLIASIKQLFKVVFSNWINVVVIFVAVYLAGFIGAIVIDKFEFDEALFGSIYLTLGYGIMFWMGFIILIVLLDIFLFSFSRQPRHTNYKLIAEWILISTPFIYWLIKYNQWIFLVATLAFAVGQFLRRRRIFRILQY